ncbi:hypothetical protein FO519_001256 [Halicephalobus sp. NKZ332]|nr:hypothetical protein FO519_001256 [Halicephalobus sp. NKZ332]
MPLSQEEIVKIVDKIQDDYHVSWETRDAKKVAQHYHPQGILVYLGEWAARGRDEIEEKYKEFLKDPVDFKLTYLENLEAGNGEYIIHKGYFTFVTQPDQKFIYEQIFKREPDGSYLIYHDEVSIAK